MPINPDEVLSTMEWVDSFYRSSDGLGRPNGMSIDGKPDFEAIAAWVFDVFVNSRLSGLSAEASRQNVLNAIEQTTEWLNKNAARTPKGLRTAYRPMVNVDRAEFLKAVAAHVKARKSGPTSARSAA